MHYDAVFLDAGGVLVVPDVDVIADALASVEIPIGRDQELMSRAHHLGMRAIDSGPPADEGTRYAAASLEALGVPPDRFGVANRALQQLSSRPASELWRAVPPGTRDGLRDLEATGVTLAVVSNSDGTVEDALRGLGLCQVGDGAGVGMCIVVDSFVVGAEKPSPVIFGHALRASGAAPERTLHVGDGVRYDVEGARAAGIRPMHFDPFGLCAADDHPHVASLGALAQVISGRER